ncbi:MAG TPA: O-antigen ligase family protein [Candidatus Paceibacterota bacterium]|nr:O-antigen ligase family protein [Candidatus Paceibacterota bacterium]
MITDTIFSHPIVASVIAGLLLLGIIAKLMKVSFERIAKWYLYASVFSVVIVMDSIFFPFIGGKDFYFRFATELALACMVFWWAFEAKKGEAKARISVLFHRPLVIAVTAFTAIFEIACLFAYDIHAAFWSNYERGEGGFQMLHYYLFFLLLVLIFKDEKDWKNIFRFSLISAGAMILYGIGGNYSVPGFIGPYSGSTAPTGWWNLLIQGRFEGSLGNPAYVDPYLIFSMFFAAYLWVASKMAGKLTTLKSWGYGVLIAVFFFFFALGQTRGAFLGLDAGLFVLLGYLVMHESRKVRNWAWACVLLPSLIFFAVYQFMGHGVLSSLLDTGLFGANFGILVFLAALSFSKSGAMRISSRIILGIIIVVAAIGVPIGLHHLAAVENVPESRVLQISLSDSSAQTRFWVWEEAWQGFLERPVLGWGPENFTAVFDKFFNPNFYVPGQNTETWFDRAHSVYFDYLSETGIFGLLSYLAMFVVFYWEFIKKAHKRTIAEERHAGAYTLEKGLVFSLLVAYLVQGIAIFDVFPMYISLFLFLAFAAYYFSDAKKSHA